MISAMTRKRISQWLIIRRPPLTSELVLSQRSLKRKPNLPKSKKATIMMKTLMMTTLSKVKKSSQHNQCQFRQFQLRPSRFNQLLSNLFLPNQYRKPRLHLNQLNKMKTKLKMTSKKKALMMKCRRVSHSRSTTLMRRKRRIRSWICRQHQSHLQVATLQSIWQA